MRTAIKDFTQFDLPNHEKPSLLDCQRFLHRFIFPFIHTFQNMSATDVFDTVALLFEQNVVEINDLDFMEQHTAYIYLFTLGFIFAWHNKKGEREKLLDIAATLRKTTKINNKAVDIEQIIRDRLKH